METNTIWNEMSRLLILESELLHWSRDLSLYFTLIDQPWMVIQATPICGIQITRIRGRPLRIVILFNSRAPFPDPLRPRSDRAILKARLARVRDT